MLVLSWNKSERNLMMKPHVGKYGLLIPKYRSYLISINKLEGK